MPRKVGKLEFRYYEIPHGERVLALYGDAWIRPYGYDEQLIPITDLHFHNLLELGICIYGKGEVILEDQSYEYGAGTVTIIPKNFPHTTNSENRKLNKWEYLFIDIDKCLQELYPENSMLAKRLSYRINRTAFCGKAEQYPQLAGMIKAILEEMKNQGDLYRESVLGLLRSLIVCMARMNPELIPRKEDEAPKKSELTQIMRALEYVGDHYDREIKIADLAGVCHISETHFRRQFLKCMGIHPVDYINQVRIKNACELLKKTDLSITEISLQCGFSSASTFNRNFHKFLGMNPNKWKNLPENYERRLNQSNITYYDGW